MKRKRKLVSEVKERYLFFLAKKERKIWEGTKQRIKKKKRKKKNEIYRKIVSEVKERYGKEQSKE